MLQSSGIGLIVLDTDIMLAAECDAESAGIGLKFLANIAGAELLLALTLLPTVTLLLPLILVLPQT